MAIELGYNGAYSTVRVKRNAGANTISLATGTGSRFAVPADGNSIRVQAGRPPLPGEAFSVVSAYFTYTGVSGDTLTGVVAEAPQYDIDLEVSWLIESGFTTQFANELVALATSKLSNIAGLILEGSNVTITGSGTAEDPYIISSTGGGGGGGGTATVWRVGSGVPSDGLGNDGDLYLRSTNSDVYQKASGTYSVVANIKGATGATGATGGTGATGSTGPAGPGLPTGGVAGQLPVKVNGTDYNTAWGNAPILKGHKVPVTTLTDASTVDINASTASAFRWTLGADRTATFNAAGQVDGIGFVLQITAAGHSVTWPASVQWIDGSEPVLPSTLCKLVFTWDTVLSKWLGSYSGPVDAVTGVPDGGATGAVLRKNSATDGDADFDVKGLQINSWKSQANVVGSAGATPTLDFAAKAKHILTLTANCAPTFSGIAADMEVRVVIKQDASTPYTFTWPGGITYDWQTSGGTAPSTPAAGKTLTVVLWFPVDATHAIAYVAGSNA